MLSINDRSNTAMSSTEIYVGKNGSANFSNALQNEPKQESGYDIPVFGLQNGKFSFLHITALSCIAVSILFSFITLVVSNHSSKSTFYKKTKSERLVVYLAILDCLFSITHSMDHLQIFITEDHVQPPNLCVFYAFMLGVLGTAQMLVVHIVAINVFCMIFLQMDLKFGRFDWRLISFATSVPFVLYLIAATLGKLGPTGAL